MANAFMSQKLLAESVQFLEPKGSSGGGRGECNLANFGGGSTGYLRMETTIRINNATDNNRNNQGFTRLDEDPFAQDGQIDISDDDLPF